MVRESGGDDYWRDVLESERLVKLHGVGSGVFLKTRGDVVVELEDGSELRLVGGEGGEAAAGGGLGRHGGGNGGSGGGELAELVQGGFDRYR